MAAWAMCCVKCVPRSATLALVLLSPPQKQRRRRASEMRALLLAVHIVHVRRCCVCCLEKIMQFINRNAYIMVGVKGTGYCASAARALSLIVSVRER